MFKKFFARLKQKKFAKQLRQPTGSTGINVGIMMNKSNEILYDFVCSRMLAKENDSILEIGFGNGKFFDKIFSKTNNIKITGIDFSDTMLKEARERNKAAIDSGILTLEPGNSDKLPFADNSFDKVFCINVIYFWDEPVKHLTEIYRVLKSGGKFYAIFRSKSSMQLMPFTQFGFTTYNEEEWKQVLSQSQLQYAETAFLNEPTLYFDKKAFNIYSKCIVAVKP